MRAHILHDDAGNIRSVVFQATEVEGELEIQSDQKGDVVTVVELDEIFPEIALDAAFGRSRHQLHLITRDIRSRFRIDVKRKTLEALK